jgi:enoyl-CoA hydratase/carnithine racemase
MDPLLVKRVDGVVEVTLNRPEVKNALNPPMLSALKSLLDEVADREDDRVLVLGGIGGAFCSGADFSASARDETEHTVTRIRRFNDVALTLHRLPKPSIAKVGGVAVGAGFNLALGCDLVVASDEARFSQIFVQRGLSIDMGGTWLLPRLIGLQQAKELAFFGDFITASDAERLGLINRVVPPSELDTVVGEWASRLANLPSLALRLSKMLLNASFSHTMDESLELEATSQAVNSASEDGREARQAFLEKRPAKFKGR